jgi:hypothetical protein
MKSLSDSVFMKRKIQEKIVRQGKHHKSKGRRNVPKEIRDALLFIEA